ncbi:MAG: hypothetical protein J0M36_07625 [Caulobacterales bacterium]|nr:hypothetical protein [Caulobacterales bacterium]
MRLCFVVLIALISLISTPLVGAPLPQAAADFTHEPGQDHAGNDLGMVEVAPRDYQTCRAMCAANSQCAAFNIYTPAPHDKGYCWIKHTAGPARSDPNSIGGVRLTASSASQVAASNQPIPLTDGRLVTLPTSAPGCSPGRLENLGSSAMATFDCGSAQVQVLVSTPPMEFAPNTLLEAHATRWQPDFMSWPADQRATFLRRENRTLANGAHAAFHCLTYDDVAALKGSSYCILDQPQAQVVLAADAPMASDAANGMNAVLSRIILR